MVDKFLNIKRDSISINFVRFYEVFMKDYLIWVFLVRFDETLKIWSAKLLFDKETIYLFLAGNQIIINYSFCYDPLTKNVRIKKSFKKFHAKLSKS
jgi:hypothetical protein